MASLRWVGRRVADLARGLVDTFLRDNRLLPPVLALLALFVFAWVLAGVFIGGTDEQKPVANRSEFAQADGATGSDPAAPEVDNPNVDSYAAFRSKDPFRRILVFARTTPEETTTDGGRDGGNRRAADSDRDGLPDRKEAIFGQEPSIPDTDGDGIPDGLDDSDGDGIPDGVEGGAAGGGGNNSGSGGGRGAGGQPGRDGDLLDSGGTLSPP